MATVGIFIDTDQGHIFPALGLAERINDLGHEVHFLGIYDVGPFILSHGFEFHPVFEDVYPKGSIDKYKKLKRDNNDFFAKGKSVPRLHEHFNSILNDNLASLLETINLDLLVVTYALSPETILINYLYPTLPILILTTWLRGVEISPRMQAFKVLTQLDENIKTRILTSQKVVNMEDFVTPLNKIPEIITCPKEFDLENKNFDTEVHYVGPTIRKEIVFSDFIANLNIPEGKKIIYASLGSQTALFREKAIRFFKLMFQLMTLKSSSEWFLILSIGNEVYDENFVSIEGKIEVVKWAPQLEVLNSADLVITHGGLGTVKESISSGVPLLVFPLVNDAFFNAQQVESNGLGLSLDIETAEVNEINSSIKSVLNSKKIKNKVVRMQEIFNKKDSSILNEVIEKSLMN